jgi:hypothetical protein
VRYHKDHHRAYLLACDEGWAPVSEREGEKLRVEGFRLAAGETLADRVKGAEMVFDWKYNEHRAKVLLHGEMLRSRHECFERLDRHGFFNEFGTDACAVLRERYS